MFDFLFRNRKPEEKTESQRERFERLILELNEVIDTLPEKPAVTVHPETGRISFTLPKQFMDEALALPKPDASPDQATPKPAQPDSAASDAAQDALREKPASSASAPTHKTRKRPGTPVPRPPKPKAPAPRKPD